MGPGPQDDKEARVLNRIVRWTERGREYEADQRQAEKLLREVGLDEGTKSLGTPAVKAIHEQIDAGIQLGSNKTSPYRAIVARANYLFADRPDCQLAAKEICRSMAEPTSFSAEALKRLGRYLVQYPRLVYSYCTPSRMALMDLMST